MSLFRRNPNFKLKSIFKGHHHVTYKDVTAIKCPFDYTLYQIITPTYNRPDLLKRSIDSVLNQRNQNDFDWEMIIVNDSPLFDYTEVEKYLTDINDTKLKYLKNHCHFE